MKKKKEKSDHDWMYEREKKHPSEWRKLLHELYRENYIWYTVSEFNSVVEHPILAPRLGVSQRSLEKSIQFFKANGLVTHQDMSGTPYVFLTPEGFKIAREEQNYKNQGTLQSVIIYLTTIIALTQVYTLFSALEITSPTSIFYSYIAILMLSVLFFFFIFRRFR